MATSWLRGHGILAASGCCQPVPARHRRVGAEPHRIPRLVLMGDFGARCCRSTTCTMSGAGTVQAVLSPPQWVPVVAWAGEAKPAQPEGRHPRPAGAEQVCPALPALGVLRVTAALPSQLRKAPGSNPQAPRAQLPGLQQRAGGAKSITQVMVTESLRPLLAVPEPGQRGCALPCRGVTSPTACPPASAKWEELQGTKAWVRRRQQCWQGSMWE